MNRLFTCIVSIAFVTLLFWIYWSSTSLLPVSELILLDVPYHSLIQNTLLKPVLPKCIGAEAPPYLLIIVTSYVGHVELRNAHRRAMPQKYLRKFNATRIFLLAKIPQNEKYITQAAVDDESSIFGDILQGSFIENYRNLTHKHLMGMQWAANHCNRSTYILKVDDDIVFNLEETYKLLKTQRNIDRQNFLLGYILNNTIPRRAKQNKWYVSEQEYQLNVYPPYVSGWYYITTPQVAARLSEAATYHPYFWIDDIFVTGILSDTLQIKLQQLPNNFWLEYYELLECCLRDMIQKHIKCNYVIGPNGSRNNLIYEFNDALKRCQIMNNCTDRPKDLPLNRNCIAYKERKIFGSGKSEVHSIRL